MVVATGSPACDDDGPGSQERPWCTLGKAAASARAGDTVLVRAGTYVEATQGQGVAVAYEGLAPDLGAFEGR